MLEELQTIKGEGEGEKIEEKSTVEFELLQKMAEAGIFYGRKKTKTHPRMKRFIYATRNGSEILDLEKTAAFLEEAGNFIETLAQKRAIVLCVGTTPAAKDLIKKFAESSGYPFVIERWLGGTLTNFKTLSGRLQYFIKLKSDREAGRLEKYTKKERLNFDREIDRLKKLFGGLETLKELPDALLIVGSTSHDTAVREARIMKIPIISILSTDADPEKIQYPIPANDRARSSIQWLLEVLVKRVEAGKKTPIIEEIKTSPQREEKNKVQ